MASDLLRLEVTYRSADTISAVYKFQLRNKHLVTSVKQEVTCRQVADSCSLPQLAGCESTVQIEFKGENAERRSSVSPSV